MDTTSIISRNVVTKVAPIEKVMTKVVEVQDQLTEQGEVETERFAHLSSEIVQARVEIDQTRASLERTKKALSSAEYTVFIIAVGGVILISTLLLI